MRIVVTNHAKERVMERFGCRPKNVEKVCRKAYTSSEPMDPEYVKHRQEIGYVDKIFRSYMGYVFVFSVEDEGTVLCVVTCLDYVNLSRKKRAKKHSERYQMRREESFKKRIKLSSQNV